MRVKKAYEDKLMAKNVVNQNANIDEYPVEAVPARLPTSTRSSMPSTTA